MSFWENKKIKKTKKEHHCEYCGAKIPIGNSCQNNVGTYEGDFNNYYLCERCLTFIDMYRDNSEPELGDIYEELDNQGFLNCPQCGGRYNDSNWIENNQKVELQCYHCEHEWIMDFSLEVLEKIKHELEN